MSRAAVANGGPVRRTSIQTGWYSLMRPGPRQIWRRSEDGVSAGSGSTTRCLTGAGERRLSWRRCAMIGSQHHFCWMGRSMEKCSWFMLSAFCCQRSSEAISSSWTILAATNPRRCAIRSEAWRTSRLFTCLLARLEPDRADVLKAQDTAAQGKGSNF